MTPLGPRRARPAIVAALAAAALFAGCGASGGGSSAGLGGATSGSGTGPGGSGGQTATQAHWQTALAALGPAPQTPQPIGFDAPAFVAWNDLFARNWPVLRRDFLDPRIDAEVRRQLLGISSGAFRVLAIRSLTIDTQAPIGFSGSSAGTTHRIGVHIPAPGRTWNLSATVDVGAQVQFRIAGVSVGAQVSVDLTIDVTDIRVDQEMTIDGTNPAGPAPQSPPPPQLAFRIAVRSTDPLAQQVTGPLTAILDPIIRAGLIAGPLYAQGQVAQAIAQIPNTPYGRGAAPTPGVPGAPPLEPLAISIAEDIQRDHMPFDTVFPALFTLPGFGNGTVEKHNDVGDSPIWTGHFVAGEAYRFEATGDARAEAGAARGLRGIANCLEVAGQGGLLSRCAVPATAPLYADLVGSSDFYLGAVGGVPHGAIGDISRDQYLGLAIASMSTWLRVPSQRPLARDLVSRTIDYFERNEWLVYKPGTAVLSRASPLAQTPGFVLMFLTLAKTVDPARWTALHQRYEGVRTLLWLNAWASSREVHESYYKFNLGHVQEIVLSSCETDPAHYREVLKEDEINRDVIGHHDNAWFDAIHGAVVPSAAAAMGPRVQAALERWALRDRRQQPVDLTNDPAIAKTLYNSALLTGGPILVATVPVPIEKRCSSDFLWQRSPFGVDGGGDPRQQAPGIDLTAPYWLARAYGLIP